TGTKPGGSGERRASSSRTTKPSGRRSRGSMSRCDAASPRARRLAGTLCGAALLAAGCATPLAPPEPGGQAWAGRFAVTWTPETPPPREERASGRFSLREAGDRTELEVFSPFGQTVARALSRPGA